MKNILKIGFVLFITFVFASITFALSENITQINFTSSAQTIDVNTISTIFSTQTQNIENTEEKLDTSGTILNLSSSSTTGEFYDANASACTDILTTPFSLTMRSGSANKHFCYKDSTPGTYTLTISAEGQTWTSATQEIIITAEEVEPEPEPEENPPLLIEEEIILKNGCEVEDIDGNTHTFPQENSPSEYLAVCALAEALEQGFLDSIEFIDFDFGLFVNNVNGILPENTYWQLRKNDTSASVGISEMALEAGDIVSLILTEFNPETFEEETLNDSLILTVESLDAVFNNSTPDETPEEEIPQGGGGGGDDTPPTTFSAENAIAYLESVQATDGSFGNSSLYTDWAGIAFGTGNVTGNPREILLSYLASHNSISSLLTDNERRAMTLLALGQNPYDFNGVNYIGAIIAEFDGTQFGEVDLVNDDIFALIPLSNAGYDEEDNEILETIAFIILKQREDGSWENSIDITAAAIQALKSFNSLSGVSDAISKAENYITSIQDNDGGWGNISSTSWAMQAESALNASWSKNGKTGLDYLATQQANANNNGAVLETSETLENIIWATSYAIPAGLGKSWSEIMQSVSKPEIENNSSGSQSNTSNNSNNTNNTQTPAEPAPVVCPAGDLFSTVTGQACTAVAPVDSINTQTLNNTLANQNISTNNSANNSTKQKSQTVIENETTPEITPNTLTAEAINTLPNKTASQSVPIVLGTVSGLALLYIAFKFFIL